MEPDSYVTHARTTFSMLRWAPAVAGAGLLFTFSDGPISAYQLLGALLVALTLLAIVLIGWRYRSEIWAGTGIFFTIMFGSRIFGLQAPEISNLLFTQWTCCVLIFAGSPFLLFRDWLWRFARLDVSPSAA